MSSLVEIGPVVLEKKIFKMLLMYFCYFVMISPWKRVWPFIWTNLNSLYPRMKSKMLKIYKRMDRQTDDVRQLTWAFSSGELKIQEINKTLCTVHYSILPLKQGLPSRAAASDTLWLKAMSIRPLPSPYWGMIRNTCFRILLISLNSCQTKNAVHQELYI